MELTHSFLVLLSHFQPVFTAPTFLTFQQVCSGWILSHRFITDVLFSGGNVLKAHTVFSVARFLSKIGLSGCIFSRCSPISREA